jgi:hypothetical protein
MKEGPGTRPVPKKGGTSDFRKALIWTAVPLLALGLTGFGLRVVARFSGGAGLPVAFSPAIVPLLWVLAIFTAIGFAIAGKRQVAAGMFAGIAIGLVGVGLTCFGTMVPLG